MSRLFRLETGLAALVTAGMVTCLAMAMVGLGEQIVPTWNGTYLVAACTLAAIEAFCTYHLYRARYLYIAGGTKYRLAELFVMLVLFEIVTDLAGGHAPMERGFPRIDWAGLLRFMPVFFSWLMATDTASNVDTIQREVANVAPAQLKASSDEIRVPLQLAGPAVTAMLQRFFVGGIAIFVLAGLSQSQNAGALHVQRPDQAGPLINVLIYFTLGIGMMALLRYGTLSIQWSSGRRVVAGDLAGRWLRYGLIFLVALAVFAALLPTSYGTELLGTARGGLENLLSAFGTWFAHLMQYLNLQPQNTSRVLPKHPQGKPPAGFGHGHHPARPPRPVDMTPILVIRAILFWLAVTALAVYIARSVRREQRARRSGAASRLARLAGWLGGIWRALRRRAGRVVALARSRDRRQPATPDVAPSASPLSRLRFGSMSPRERIVYYFLSVARRLEREGRRRPSQTALELEAQVGPTLADAATDMHALTQAYLEARYSAHPVGEGEERRAQSSWKRVREALRRRRSLTP